MDKAYTYTHVVIDGSNKNFKTGTKVFIVGHTPILDLVFINGLIFFLNL